MKKENGNQCGRKQRLVCRKQCNPGESQTIRQRNSKAQNKFLPGKRRRMSALVEPKLIRKENILNHDCARTIGGDKILKSSKRIGSRQTLIPLNILLLDARSWQTTSTCRGIIEH